MYFFLTRNHVYTSKFGLKIRIFVFATPCEKYLQFAPLYRPDTFA